MSGDPIAEEVQPVYGKDLHNDYFSMTIRIDADELEHGDHLKVTVEELDNVHTEPQSKKEDKSTSDE